MEHCRYQSLSHFETTVWSRPREAPILSSLGNELAFRNNSVVSASGGTDSQFSV